MFLLKDNIMKGDYIDEYDFKSKFNTSFVMDAFEKLNDELECYFVEYVQMSGEYFIFGVLDKMAEKGLLFKYFNSDATPKDCFLREVIKPHLQNVNNYLKMVEL